jgi:hypothetical protein
VPAWQVPREAHVVDFGCFALLGAELEAEMRSRKLGVGLKGINGTTGTVLDAGEKEEDSMLGMAWSSLDCSHEREPIFSQMPIGRAKEQRRLKITSEMWLMAAWMVWRM